MEQENNDIDKLYNSSHHSSGSKIDPKTYYKDDIKYRSKLKSKSKIDSKPSHRDDSKSKSKSKFTPLKI